jgi:hypothetical protein
MHADGTTNSALLQRFDEIIGDQVADLEVHAKTVKKGIMITCRDPTHVDSIKALAKQIPNANLVGENKVFPMVAIKRLPIDLSTDSPADQQAVMAILQRSNAELRNLSPEQFKFVVALRSR